MMVSLLHNFFVKAYHESVRIVKENTKFYMHNIKGTWVNTFSCGDGLVL